MRRPAPRYQTRSSHRMSPTTHTKPCAVLPTSRSPTFGRSSKNNDKALPPLTSWGARRDAASAHGQHSASRRLCEARAVRALPRGAAGTSGQPLLQQSGDANVRKHILDYVIRDGAADRAVLQQMTPLRSLPGSAPALVCLLSMIVVAHQIRVRSSREARGVARGGRERRSLQGPGTVRRARRCFGSLPRRDRIGRPSGGEHRGRRPLSIVAIARNLGRGSPIDHPDGVICGAVIS